MEQTKVYQVYMSIGTFMHDIPFSQRVPASWHGTGPIIRAGGFESPTQGIKDRRSTTTRAAVRFAFNDKFVGVSLRVYALTERKLTDERQSVERPV